MRSLLLTLALLTAAGCGGSASGMPESLVGMYKITIEANNKKDDDTMNVALGSNHGVLLDFVYGISQVRCGVVGSTGLTIPRQILHVSHSTGVMDGTAAGMGTIAADGTVNITLDLATAGVDPPDGSAGDGGTAVTYTIEGTRN
jgi:hypothetical protein